MWKYYHAEYTSLLHRLDDHPYLSSDVDVKPAVLNKLLCFGITIYSYLFMKGCKK
jgi:hypothetical protein